jgi:hypothetical protein
MVEGLKRCQVSCATPNFDLLGRFSSANRLLQPPVRVGGHHRKMMKKANLSIRMIQCGAEK